MKFWNKIIQWGKQFALILFRKINRLLMSKKKLEKEIDAIARDVSNAWSYLYAIRELLDQANINKNTYKKYQHFFDATYIAFYDELIYALNRIHDSSRDSLSLINILKKLAQAGMLTSEEAEMLARIEQDTTRKKVKKIRNKLGRAHLDGKVSTNLEQQDRLQKECAIEMNEFAAYIELLKKALEIISERLDKPLCLLKPLVPIRTEIRELFRKLSD